MFKIIFAMCVMFVSVCSAVPRHERMNYPDPDVRNRMNEHLGVLKVPMNGGGWPSTTGNPSGGGRWNN